LPFSEGKTTDQKDKGRWTMGVIVVAEPRSRGAGFLHGLRRIVFSG